MTNKKQKKKLRSDIATRFQKGHKGYRGEKNPSWKGDRASYWAVHAWLRLHYGKADKCENPDCIYPRKNCFGVIVKAPKRYEWALKKGAKYVHERDNFFMLCKSCHIAHDKTNSSHKPKI